MKVQVTLKTDKAYLCYKKLKKQPTFRERRILETFERFLFKEVVISREEELPFIINVECLNYIIEERINFPQPIRDAYNKLGCVEEEDYTIGVLE